MEMQPATHLLNNTATKYICCYKAFHRSCPKFLCITSNTVLKTYLPNTYRLVCLAFNVFDLKQSLS